MNQALVVAPAASAALADEARRKLSSADSAALLVEAMDAYRTVLRADPLNYEALATLANLHTLLGTAYTTSRREKARNFRQGIRYAELAMYTNPRFRELVDAGVKPWDASHVLTEREAEAMFFWVTGVFYLFKEGMSLPGKVSNLVWIERGGRFLGRLDQIDPEWRGGALQFSWALYYYILPTSHGGNKALARVFLERSIKDSPEWLVTRWGRAGYFHVIARDEAGFRRDLEWVLARDIARPGGELFAWKVHFQRNARFLLDHTERYTRWHFLPPGS